MSPVYLNPQHSSSIPFLEIKASDQQHSLPIFGYRHDHATITNNSYFPGSGLVNHSTCNEFLAMDYSRATRDEVVEKLGQVLGSSSKQGYDVGEGSGCSYTYSFDQGDRKTGKISNNNDKKPKKCKATKLRIMQNGTSNKIIRGENNKLHGKTNNVESHSYLRMCTDCHTTTTPLWRSGPHGPKSLCNACGIRQRKAKRAAMAMVASTSTFAKDNVSQTSSMLSTTTTNEATRVTVVEDMMSTSKIKQDVDQSHTMPLKKRSKNFVTATNNNDHNLNAFQRTFPRDEEEGAILLMSLSCGLACSS